MEIRERVTGDELTFLYGRMGFLPEEGNPFSFSRADDNIMVFHAPIGDNPDLNEFYWVWILEDLERTEQLYADDLSLSNQFLEVLAELLMLDDDAEGH